MSVSHSSVPSGVASGNTSSPEYSAGVPLDTLYHKLPTNLYFRLIEIVTVFPYLSCKMRTVSLDDHASYKALSYCWGSPERSVTLRCNGFKLKISPNLAKGLKRLHAYAVESRWAMPPLFWVDQICINQEDNAERTQQVRMMRSIYQQSTQTVVWLPLKTEIATAAKSILVATSHYLNSANGKLPSTYDRRWGALAQLLESPWFERCWILQEIAASRECPEMLCGSQVLSWSHFRDAMRWLNRSGRKHRTERMELVNSIQEVIGKNYWDIGSGILFSHLHVLLRLTSSFRSTDPRDKVFALLGLSSAGQDPEYLPEELAPDYTRPIQDVYAAAAKYCMRQTESLSVLSQFVHIKMARSTSAHVHFSSWIPRWDIADSTRRISAFSLHWSPDGYRNLFETDNKASKDTRITMDQDVPLSILRVLGMQIDTVHMCLPTVTLEDTAFHAGVPERYEDYLSSVIPQLYRTCKKQVRPASHSFDRTFFMVTTAGLTPEHWDARNQSLDAFESVINVSQERPRAQTPFLDIEDRHLGHTAESYRYQPHRTANAYIVSLQRLMGRRLFITSSGHLGLGPASMMSGDTVAILFGGNVPYILRPLENKQWHFVGECYLDGYMRGEAMEGRDSSRDEWFEMV